VSQFEFRCGVSRIHADDTGETCLPNERAAGLSMVGINRLNRRDFLAFGAMLAGSACASPPLAMETGAANGGLSVATLAPQFYETMTRGDPEKASAMMVRANAALRAFPYPLQPVPIHQGLEAHARMRSDGRGAPVIIGSFLEAASLSEEMQKKTSGFDPRSIVMSAVDFKHPDALHRLRAAQNAAYADELERGWNGQAPPDIAESLPAELARLRSGPDEPFMGEWPVTSDPMKAPDLSGFDESPLGSLLIARLPTRDWTEAPAWMLPGDRDAAPMIAAYRSWRDRFGVELIFWTTDVVSFRVARPPATRDDALQLARELYLVRSDMGFNRYVGLAELAAALMESRWWDVSGE
jgi:Domain of unknown function (DUF4253)